jgi:hypothetical protein
MQKLSFVNMEEDYPYTSAYILGTITVMTRLTTKQR